MLTRQMNTAKNDITTNQRGRLEDNRRILEEHYDVGKLIRQELNGRGYDNDSYEIEVLHQGKKCRYFLRRYSTGTSEEKVRFQHALLKELEERRFALSPRCIPTRDGATYVEIDRSLKNKALKDYIAVFSFLPGKDKYKWNTPLCSDKELKNSAKIFALYHNAIYGWQGIEGWRERSSVEAIHLMALKWQAYAGKAAESPFEEFFLTQLDDLLGRLENIPPEEKCTAMPRLAVHGDYHPGNLKFRDGKVSGVLDFGWSKIDARCFDVGLAILYFCTSWDADTDGNLQLDRVDKFLGAYQETTKKNKTVGPLDRLELGPLPQMIQIGNSIVIDWILSEYYGGNPDPQEYLKYLKHCVSLNLWLDRNRKALSSCIQRHFTK